MVGETILHYKILEKLGEGGMGVVYLAEDSKLKRKVAIKFLPRQIAADTDDRRRFEIEAQAAASLNHPNITTIHAIEEEGDNVFIVMEYIDGMELKDKIKSNPIPLKETIDIAIQIAEGLKVAHKKGIVHRDVKSQNIMITGDVKAKIMDFGLAKLKGGTQLTKIGSTIGTAAYMSPEQAKGEDVDHRTDIWSFGVVLYEMLTGHLPFKGEYEQAVVYSIINDEPVYSENVSPELDYIIKMSIAKEQKDRYQYADEIIKDLTKIKNELITESFSGEKTINKKINLSPKNKSKKWIIPSTIIALIIFLIFSYLYFNSKSKKTVTSETKRIVVLPFDNLGPSEDEYFADGITGEITSKLSGLSGLQVIARASAMQYKHSKKTLKQIGNELGVQYVLEGTVQWEILSNGLKRIRVNPELINIENSTQIWSKPFEADFSNAFTLQSDIASTVAEAMNLKLVNSEQKSLHSAITSNSEAYDLYLKAKYFAEDITNEKNSRIALELLNQAIEIDTNFAEAYAQLSVVRANMYWSYFDHSKENLEKSKANAEKALLLNSDLPDAHAAMGDYFYHGILDYDSAINEYKEALRLDPNNVNAINGMAFVYRRQGKMEETINFLKRTYKINPQDYMVVYSIGETYMLLRKYKDAVEYLDKANFIAPEANSPYSAKAAIALLETGNIKKAKKLVKEVREKKIGLDSDLFTGILYTCDILDRNYSAALKVINGIKEVDGQFFYIPEELYTAEVYDYMKNKKLAEQYYKAAIKVLESKIKQHPDDSRYYSSLGICYAGIGDKEKAIKEGKHGYELLPVTKEAWRGTFRLFDLAQIYTMTGEQDLALNKIEELLNMHTDVISIPLLKLDPRWDSLRNNKRYQELIKNSN